uniref:Centrosomal protein POC5 n=1 Tax=Pavo cristatus TaxID=9049 RepID=A0A8C9F546_PAVCR
MEQLCPVSEETSSQESTHVPREIDETTVTELTVPDEKVTQIENILDLWSGSLKTNVLSELRKWKLSFIEHHKHQMRQEKERHAEHVKQLNNEMENLKELLRTYEISIGRKDEVVFQSSIRKKEKIELMRKFTLWRIQQIKAKQEVYKQFQTALKKKVWTAWRSLSEERWKEKVAKACQLRAEDICVQLTNDYEAKIAEFSTHLGHASTSQTRLDSDPPVIIPGTAAASGLASTQKLPMAKVITSAQQKAGRTITARITGRSDMGQKHRICGSVAVMGVAPPMSSVIVEKHHPVTQTPGPTLPDQGHPEQVTQKSWWLLKISSEESLQVLRAANASALSLIQHRSAA